MSTLQIASQPAANTRTFNDYRQRPNRQRLLMLASNQTHLINRSCAVGGGCWLSCPEYLHLTWILFRLRARRRMSTRGALFRRRTSANRSGPFRCNERETIVTCCLTCRRQYAASALPCTSHYSALRTGVFHALSSLGSYLVSGGYFFAIGARPVTWQYHNWLECSRKLPEFPLFFGFVRFESFTAVTMKNGVFWDIKTQFVLHRRHITSPLQSPAC
jgi:hypothetical protein